MLLPVKTRLSDIQTRLKKILPHDAVLVGHSLNSDLQALEVSMFLRVFFQPFLSHFTPEHSLTIAIFISEQLLIAF